VTSSYAIYAGSALVILDTDTQIADIQAVQSGRGQVNAQNTDNLPTRVQPLPAPFSLEGKPDTVLPTERATRHNSL
jgi:hypothetical protein